MLARNLQLINGTSHFNIRTGMSGAHTSFPVSSQAQKHNSPLMALDFSEDSNYVQSASEDNELLYREWQHMSISRWLQLPFLSPGASILLGAISSQPCLSGTRSSP